MAAQSSLDHAKVVLSAIIPARRDLLDKALKHLKAEHFPDPMLSNLFIMLEKYATVAGSVITATALGDLLGRAGADAGKAAIYLEVYDYLAGAPATDSEFLWSLRQIRELAAERATGEALTQAMTILTKGSQDDRGADLRGHQDARVHILTRLTEIERDLAMQEAPEGDMRHEGDDIISEYADRKRLRSQGLGSGYLFGIPSFDKILDGLQPGELALTLGWTGDGKTTLCSALAWHAVVMQKKNVVYNTAENLRSQVRRKIISRHSRLPQFELPEGLDSARLKRGDLTTFEESKLQEVVDDFTNNPNYGHLHIAQVPQGSTISSLYGSLQRVQRQFEVHLTITDYLQLWKSEKSQGYREDQSSIVKDAKQLATTFDDGRGISVVSPWQVNRSAKENADRDGYYTLAATSETAEASNSPDVILAVKGPTQKDVSRYADLKGQILKNRDGATSLLFDLRVDYGTSYFIGPQQTDAVDGLLGGSSGSNPLGR